MAAAPEDPLARMARWDALHRRLSGGTGGDGTLSPMAELAHAARRVVDRHPEVAVTVTVEATGASASSVRVARVDGALTVTVIDGSHLSADGEREGTAAQLADLLRRDPASLQRRDQHSQR